ESEKRLSMIKSPPPWPLVSDQTVCAAPNLIHHLSDLCMSHPHHVSIGVLLSLSLRWFSRHIKMQRICWSHFLKATTTKSWRGLQQNITEKTTTRTFSPPLGFLFDFNLRGERE